MGYILGNLIGPLIAFGIMWYIGYKKESQKLQWTAILCYVGYEVSFWFGFLVMMILAALGGAVFYTIATKMPKYNGGGNENEKTSKKDSMLRSAAAVFSDVFFDRLDTLWRTQDSELYDKFISREAIYKKYFFQAFICLAKDKKTKKNAKQYQMVTFLRGVSISLMYVFNLVEMFSEYDFGDVIEQITGEIIMGGYLRNSVQQDFSNIVASVDQIANSALEELKKAK